MKQKLHAKDRREAGKRAWGKKTGAALPTPAPAPPKLSKEERARLEAEETKEFLAYLENANVMNKDAEDLPARKKTGMPVINLEEGMPTVEEALAELRINLQFMRVQHVKMVKLIHGYGSTGKGGRIRIGVRKELAALKNKRMIRDFVIGEDFGPFNEACREAVAQDQTVRKDIDYGRSNHGITVVML